MGCNARQFSDQMSCSCGNVWDMNDPCPPECKHMMKAPKKFNSKFHKWLYTLKHLARLLDVVHRATIDIDDLKKQNRTLQLEISVLRRRINQSKDVPLSDD